MSSLDIINLIANILIMWGGAFFIIGIFGRKSQTINNLSRLERWFLKGSLSFIASGSLFNILTMTTPPVSEIVLNIGLGGLFLWASWFHFEYFIWKKNKPPH